MQKKDFDPNAVAQENAGIFGLSYTPDEAKVLLIPAPWGVTVSYGGGTHDGPRAIFEASPQIDYYHETYGGESWKLPIAMLPLSEREELYERGTQLRTGAEQYIDAISKGQKGDLKMLAEINVACEVFHEEIKQEALDGLAAGKLVGLIGGDHSTPLGLMKALAETKGDYAILQIDAHCDLRESYEGFAFSHASIMWNALYQIPQVKKLVQVGIRDYSPGEYEFVKNSNGRVETFFDTDLKERSFNGETWEKTVADIVSKLPEQVYLSFDIDGLDPALCPGTGTPVPGGLSFQQAIFLIKSVATSGRTIIGFDLNEVSPQENDHEWNANVGMRVLWNMVLWAAKSNKITLAE